jgi:hypothetical protein
MVSHAMNESCRLEGCDEAWIRERKAAALTNVIQEPDFNRPCHVLYPYGL